MLVNKSTLNEQSICKSCGFCCDGTLFSRAALEEGEKGHLPEGIEKRHFWHKGAEKFKLPCPYFDKKCSIYDQKKAIICSAYRCQLLNNFSSGQISQEEALSIVQNAILMRKEIFDSYKLISGLKSVKPFNEILNEISQDQQLEDEGSIKMDELKRFSARCKIFESLLIKYFKSEDDFQEMLAKEINKR